MKMRAVRESDAQSLHERCILEQYAPPSVLVDGEGEILHFVRQTSKYLEPPVGVPTHNLFDVVRGSLRLPLRAALHQARQAKLLPNPQSWALQRAMLQHLQRIWTEPDEGLWETRGGRQHFTFSKVMAWVAFDRCIRDAEEFGLQGPLDEWRAARELIHATVCRDGFDAGQNSFTQAFGGQALDASLLLIPIVGFLPHHDPRIRGTVAAIEQGLMQDGFVLRYRTEGGVDGLPDGEGAFLACSFWLASALHQGGREADARALFERLLALRWWDWPYERIVAAGPALLSDRIEDFLDLAEAGRI